MRQTAYVKGDGIFDTLLEGIKTVASTKALQDSLSEGVKAASKSAGSKLGSKLVKKKSSKIRRSLMIYLKKFIGNHCLRSRI